VQEALTNISRHAQAKRVDITLRRDGTDLLLEVQDDGLGFDLAAMNQRALAGGSLGVLGMQERATLLGGQLDIGSAPGAGCTVRLRCPWRNLEDKP
jgi:two-component system sensor histidine kinase UhpB